MFATFCGRFTNIKKFSWVCALCLWFGAMGAEAQELAPGFERIAPGAKVLIVPPDIELFTLSAGGVLEPRADWTTDANRYFREAMLARKKSLGVPVIEADDKQVDDVAEFNSLHAAVASAIVLHHYGPRNMRLPTKEGYMNWSMGPSVRTVKEKTGADYALFTWIRDSYATGGRVATAVVLAALRVSIPMGVQQGYASLVDLNTGQIVWFNQLRSGRGDMREADKAARTLEWLLGGFPAKAP
jgi:hypothetical protein